VAGPHLTVTPTSVQLNEPFSVSLTGLEPSQKVTVSSRFVDYQNREWTASATWEASGTELDLGAQPPIEGDFTVPDPTALIWAANGAPYYAPTMLGEETVAMTAAVDGRQIGQETVARGLSLPDDQPTYIYTEEMVGNFFAPAPGFPTPAPAVICLGGSDGGLSPFVDLTAAVLASRGYATLNLAYFLIGRLPPALKNIPLAYFGRAIAWFQQQPSVRKDRIGVIGYSRGGELALLLGAHYPELTAVVSFSGSGYAFGAPGEPAEPAWTWQGEPVPYLNSTHWPPPAQDLARAEIPVEQTNGPILMISGDGDALWPSSFLTKPAWDRLQRTRHPWPDQFLHYPGAGHAILTPYMPMLPLVPAYLGGDPLSNEIASVNSWQAVLHLFEERLRY
jgi:dienelactone hydrolase